MGLFDTVRCRYPLPHHQHAEFQTKDLAAVALDERWVGGLLDQYEITDDGRLRRHVHERVWTEDPHAPFGGYLRSVRDWWEDIADAHGDIFIYTSDDTPGEAPPRLIEFRVRFTNGRVQEVREVVRGEESERDGSAQTAADGAAGLQPEQLETDDRPEVRELLANLKSAAGTLRRLLDQCSGEWGYEDPIYRFYHQSFKIYALQEKTTAIVAALEDLLPRNALNEWFLQIVREGTGGTFGPQDNARWPEETRPILEAFFHARYFLDMAVRYGGRFSAPPRVLPSGWAALLELYRLR